MAYYTFKVAFFYHKVERWLNIDVSAWSRVGNKCFSCSSKKRCDAEYPQTQSFTGGAAARLQGSLNPGRALSHRGLT